MTKQKAQPKNWQKENVPKLRFPGFSDEWKENKLGEIGNIIGGGNPDTTKKEYCNSEIKFFRCKYAKDILKGA